MCALSVVEGFTRLRRHWPFWIVLGVAIGMRVWFVYAYPYAFFFPDSRTYVASAQDGFPNVIRPWGYSALILPLLHQPYLRIAILQHLIGLAVIVAGYAFLRRRGCRPWLSALAMAPLALDARVLTLEHYVLAETAYLAFTAAGLFLIAWRDKVGWVAAALGGASLACAALTRSVGLPILALAGVYLLVRRAGILRIIAYVVPVVALLGGYMVFYHQQWGVYSMGQNQGRFLYARVVSIADCDKLKLTADQRRLCLPNPTHSKSWDQRPDQFIWSTASPAYRFYHDKEDDPALQKYALTVIEQEPVTFLALVARQTSWHLRWRAPLVDDGQCLADQWLPPQRPGDNCVARYYLPVKIGDAPAPSFLVDNPQAKAWHAYGNWGTTPGPLYAVGILVTLFAAVWRFRRRPWRDAADAMLFTFGGFGLLIVSVATSLFDYRYSEPAVLMIPVGMALAVNRIVALARTPARLSQTPAPRVEIPPQRSAALSETPATSDADSEPPTTQIERAPTA